ncbi:hypothetical protein [Halomonas sp. N3-2A]|uniref:hypothetical protein n=1 Tax=Halomonas sp. N3-2A TaxID=2014541 RepID=UPI000B5B183F|nr:hypothetical protein [Halomonas sp. N3-2A]ASK18859.1 hypothetical protein CEK60_05875 [Halomonas sp. N3-2A]
MDLLQAVVQDVPEAPLMSVRDAIRWSEFRLCQDGNAWIVDAPVTSEGAIMAPVDTTCVRALAVYRNGRAMMPGADYGQPAPDVVTIHRQRNADTYTARIAVKPTSDNALPAELRDQYFETLRHGATHRLLLLPQPWRNVEQAAYHETHFTAGINDAYRLSVYGQQQGARVQPRRFI